MKMNLKRNDSPGLVGLVLLVGISFIPSVALAITACAQVDYWDSRTRRSDNSGSRVTGTEGQNRPAKGVRIWVYDRDGSCVDFDPFCFEADDDYINGYHETNLYGGVCVDILTSGEDIYFVSKFTSNVADIENSDGSNTLIWSQVLVENLTSNIYSLAWNITCPNDNYNNTSGHCDSQSDVDTYFAGYEPRANMLATIGEVNQYVGLMGWHGYNGRVIGEYDTSGCGCGSASDRDNFCVGSLNCANSNHVVGHEVGHLIHSRALADYGTGSYDYTDVPLGGCSASATTKQTREKCVISEGWASFVSSATMWEPGSSNPWYTNQQYALEGEAALGNGGTTEACAYQNDDPEMYQMNATRWFWDLYDSTVVGETSTEDNATQSLSQIIGEWEEFPYGTDDREAGESGDHGRNAKDYKYYNGGAATELTLNCLTGHEP